MRNAGLARGFVQRCVDFGPGGHALAHDGDMGDIGDEGAFGVAATVISRVASGAKTTPLKASCRPASG